MTLRDILPDHPIETIMVRANAPLGYRESDMLVGYCSWDGEKLISLDGDSYDLDDEVEKYEYSDDILTYWEHIEWKYASNFNQGENHEDSK